MLLPVAVIVEQVLEKALKFSDVNDNGAFFQLSKNFGLAGIDLDSRVEKLKKQIGGTADFIRQQAGVMIIRIAPEFIDPRVGQAAGNGRECFFLYFYHLFI